MPDVVAARGLGVRYGGRRSAPTDALTAIDLACHDGETVGVLGPNGAGKSTLLAALATLLRPTSGELRLFGRPAEPAPGMRRRLGYAPDAAPHFDALSGRENALFFARASGLAAEPARTSVDRLLDRLDLADDADRPVGEYSFGMGRKLALVEALAHEPGLLLLDEPTVGLDPRALDALRGLLRERAAAGTTIVIATNDVREAQSVCDRVVFLQHGRIVLEGEPAALVRASGARTRIEVGLDSDTAPVPALPDVEAEAAAPGRLVLRSAAGADVLPDVCRALVDAGVGIRSIRVREPDLRDVFFEATGAELAPAADGTSARATEPAATLSHARA